MTDETLSMAEPGEGVARRTVDVASEELARHAEQLFAERFRLALVAAHDDGDQLRVVYLFTAGNPDRRVELHLRAPADRPVIPSLAGVSFPASRFEREMQDLFGIEPAGHPQPARLVLHQHWPEGWRPMRRGAGTAPVMDQETRQFPFASVQGSGVYEIPVGPVHAGLIEPGHFRFWVVGETIVAMKARLWFVHKGIERLFEGRDPVDGLGLAERISGDTAVGHGWAYCQAIEQAAGCTVPRGVTVLRAILLELERLYNHVGDIGALCNDVGFGVVNAHALRIRERLLRLNASVTGHRLLRGGIFPGGAAVSRLPDPVELTEIAADLSEIVALALGQNTLYDRFSGTSVLSNEQAVEIGTLGYVARASGVGLDARIAHPAEPGVYQDLRVPILTGGDVMARFQLRVEEFDASIALLLGLIAEAAGGELSQRVDLDLSGSAPRSGVGIIEGWRGTIVHRVEVHDGLVVRVKVVDPSFMNWPAVAVSLKDTIVPDFPLTNKSFNLSYAGNDL